MSGRRFDLVALGEPLLEFNQTRDASDQYLQGFGGDTSNCVIAAARLGAATAYITRLGDDAFGRKFLALWQRERVDASGVAIDADASTGIYFVTHGASGHEFSYLRAGSAASRCARRICRCQSFDRPRCCMSRASARRISASACDTVFAAIDAAREAGARISFDCNVRPKLWPLPRAKAVIVATIGLCDWFLPSLDEAVQLSGKEQPDAILDWCHAQGAPVVALKMGGEGVWVSTERLASASPACALTQSMRQERATVSTARSPQDSSPGDTPFAAGRYANAAAALATTGYGAVAPLPRHADVAALLATAGR
jgi:2-dehydro-3-deoxygluconokinase